jgi:hypothetical protein
MSLLNFPDSESFNSEDYIPQQQTGVHFQGTYTLDTLRIKLKNNQIVELGNVFTEIEVFEDVFKYSIEGRIRIKDYVGGIEKFIITGGEEIAIRALKPNGQNEIILSRDDLIVTKLSPIVFTQNNFRTYDLFFTSRSSINSMKKKVFKSFGSDRNLVSIVQKLFSEIGDTNNIAVHNSNIFLNNAFVCPGKRPLDAINMLAKRACVDGDYFLFFERFAKNPTENFTHAFIGFNTLKEFWTENNSIPKITYEPNTSKVNYIDENESESNVSTFYVRLEQNFDHMAFTKSGFYNSRIRTLDLINQNYTDTKLDYLNESEDNLKTIYNNRFVDRNNIFTDYDTTTIERLIVRPRNDTITNKNQWLKFDTYGSVLNSGIRVTVQISGATNKIGVGNLIELSIPSQASKTIRYESPVPHEDQVYSGKYMVTATKHFLTPKSYTKTLELSRGSLRFDIDTLVERFSAAEEIA